MSCSCESQYESGCQGGKNYTTTHIQVHVCACVCDREGNVAVFGISNDREVADTGNSQTAIRRYDIVVVVQSHGIHYGFNPSYF